ncbi:DEKNAAC100802 [Brettanomyces naardenensis]|uniref:DEKNAAC100802 n=1 Tax=Brettanomyces naardenensis TaxID=13370 RepID=A0A448YF35_BRENA|nr:DEKNAAC100802 [Brettanomyces naardenensis]
MVLSKTTIQFLSRRVIDHKDLKPTVKDTVWKLIITQALNTFQGIVGQAILFDILFTDDVGLEAIVRVPTVDKSNFVDCIVASTVQIDPGMIGVESSVKEEPIWGSIRSISRSQYLVGITGPDRFKWYNIDNS